jgi:molecular chaperone HtpG
MSEEQLSFQAEVGRILDIVANSLYSEREVFLRELVSNASDACDRLRYLAITAPDLTADDPSFKITLSVDKKAKTLTLADNGLGMGRQDLIENLGTIARSGSSVFVEQLSGDASKDVDLIGRFGVGFYSAFMVADKVDVVSRKAGDEAAWVWSSDGRGAFTVAEAEREGRGTSITLHLRKDASEFLDADRLRRVVKTHSDHIGLPIMLATDEGEDALNEASALWTKAKKDINAEQYTEFYRHISHQYDEPWLVVHNRAEGRIEYTSLLFIPSNKPLDLFEPDRRHRVKLYVKRIFITDDCEGLVPPYLRFLRGLVDSQDLPLNVSREMLQHNPMVDKIRSALVKRVLGELEKKAEKAPDDYAVFWDNFGPVLKEGIYEDNGQRDRLMKLARFRTTSSEGKAVSLADYIARMREGQEAIYYITGEDADKLNQSPQLEGFKARGVEVLLFADPVDAFWISAVTEFDGKPLTPANRGEADLDKITAAETSSKPEPDEAVEGSALGTLIAAIKQNLGEAVADVRASARLTDSPVCLVADESALDPHLERLLRAHQQLDQQAPRILEINPRHALIKEMAARAGEKGGADALADHAQLLFDQARILDGEPVPDPGAFARRMSNVMARGIPA